MNKKISYFPMESGSNSYPVRMRDILSQLGDVKGASVKELALELTRFDFKKDDCIIINWIESEVLNPKGKFSLRGALKVLIKIFIFKIKFKKVIYVLHNLYPHQTDKSSVNNVVKFIGLIEFFSSNVIVHSPKLLMVNRSYIPHPLYNYPLEVKLRDVSSVDKDLFVIFGRIVPYKKIEEVISVFPENKKLIILGKCEDIVYLEKLKLLSLNKKNIKIMPEYMKDKEVEKLINSSNGMIINHADKDMIVSGSFFYGITLGARILSVETPFLSWVEEELGEHVVKNFSNINEMVKYLSSDVNASCYEDGTEEKINALFGDEQILRKMKSIV